VSLPIEEPVHKPGEAASRGMSAVLRERALWPLWVGGTVFATSLAAPFTFFAAFVMTEKIGSAGLFFSCYSIAAVTLRIVGSKLPERVGPKRVLFPAMVVIGVGLSTLVVARTPLAVAVAGVCAGLGHGYTFPILLGLLVSRAR